MFFVNLYCSNGSTALGLSPVEGASCPLRHETERKPLIPYFSEDCIHTKKTASFQTGLLLLPSPSLLVFKCNVKLPSVFE